MIRETNACLWPRAIIDVIPAPGTQSAAASILRNFDPHMSQAQSRIRLDVTHLQPVMGSPSHIAQHIRHRFNSRENKSVTMGVASDPYIAAYASGTASSGDIKTIAPWDVRSNLQHESVEDICLLQPELAHKLRRVGICTGSQFAALPLSVVRRVFGDAAVVLWRACRGETNAAALEVDDQYHSIRCRAVLPPRTTNQRSIHSHLRRVTNSLLSILRSRQRIPAAIYLSMREQQKVAIEVGALDIECDELNPRDLASSVQQVFSRNWQGGALCFVELTAQQLYDPSGQLELFDGE